MRKGPLAAAVVAVLAVSACKAKDQAMNDDLARDVALATDGSGSGLSLAPSRGSQLVVSTEERTPEARPRKAPSARSSRATPHRTPHRDRVAAHHSTEVASIAAPVAEEAPAPQPVADQAPADNSQTQDAPVAESPRPHPVAVGSYPGSGNGSGSGGSAGRGGGISIGDVIGVIGAVVIRGGVVDGDHCDPRGRRRRMEPETLVNNRGPVLRGSF